MHSIVFQASCGSYGKPPHSKALRYLIGEGLDLEVTNTGGHTLLQLAQERGKELCAQVLLREGAHCIKPLAENQETAMTAARFHLFHLP